MSVWRHQLASYSPIRLRDVWSGARALLPTPADPLADLSSVLVSDYDATRVILTDSGTQALELAMRVAMSRLPTASSSTRARVALPAFQCFDLATAAIGAAVPVAFYDVDPDTLAPDLASLERVLRDDACVAVIAPLYGIPVDWDALTTVAARQDAQLIEDAAQGYGAEWRGTRVGTLGDVSVLSFGRGKGWTGGRGGALLLRGAATAAADTIPGLSRPGVSSDARNVATMLAQWALGRPAVYGLPHSIPSLHLGETVYHPPSGVRGMRESAARAVLSSRGAARAEERARRAMAAVMANVSRGARAIAVLPQAIAGYIRYPVRLNGGMSFFASPEAAMRAGVAPSYPIVLPELPALRASTTARAADFPGARTLVSELITLPTHSRVDEANVRDIAALFRGR